MKVEVEEIVQPRPPKKVYITLDEYEAEGLATILFFGEIGAILLSKLEDQGIWFDESRIEVGYDNQQTVRLNK